MIEDQLTSKLVSSQNLTDKKNISYKNSLSTVKHRVCSDKGTLNKPKSAVVTTCIESENSGNIKNTKSVDENIQESTITSRKLQEKMTCKTQMTTNVNSSMERSVLLRKMFQKIKVI